jgi:shikimate dehydrogenase
MRFGLIGNPISHSLSPALFKAGYPDSTNSYELLESNSIIEAMQLFRDNDFIGLNVTTPYKEEILQFVDNLNPVTKLICASNLILKSDLGLTAYNTDYYGVQQSLQEFVQNGTRVVVLGSGGAGRAAALAAKDAGCSVILLNRTKERSLSFSNKSGIENGGLDQLVQEISNCKIFINTIPSKLALLNKIDFAHKVVLEANYRDPQLSFVEKKYNAKYISGKHWLLHQAVQSFQLFTNQSPNVESMRFIINNI